MDKSMARQKYSTSRPMRNRRRRKTPQRSGGLRKLILFQSLICALIFMMVIITKNIRISATDYITAQVKYVLEHDVEPKSVSSHAGKLLADVRGSIFPDSPTASDYPLAQALDEAPVIKGNLSMSEGEVYERGDDDSILTSEIETSVLSASSDFENGNLQSALQLLNPVMGTLATDYGQISAGADGNAKIHSGIDIHVEQRSNVKAVLNGIVTKTGSSVQYGNYIMIGHDNDLETVYAHCSDILMQAGENVGRGDVIAQVGDDSISVGSHLHFEVWLDGNSVDPLEYISVDDR